jgi:hypothetical protein
VKILFVGEGSGDIGKAEHELSPRPAGGAVATLARKACPKISPDSIAIQWINIKRYSPKSKKGLAGKVAAAMLLAHKFGCEGTICVADKDRDNDRLSAMEEGIVRGQNALGAHPALCAVAVESVEAWTLGAPEAIADVIGVPARDVRHLYPHPRVEELFERSGKEEHRPKSLLSRILALGNSDDSTQLREDVAERTDIEELLKACPEGFRPFFEKLQSVFRNCPDGCGRPHCEGP